MRIKKLQTIGYRMLVMFLSTSII